MRSLVVWSVLGSLATAALCALVAPVMLLLGLDPFTIFALGGAAFVYAHALGGESVLNLAAPSGGPLSRRLDLWAVRSAGSLGFVVAASRAWSEQIPWLTGPLTAALCAALSLVVACATGSLLVRTLQGRRAAEVVRRAPPISR
jgi:hypothetical protein